MEEPPVALDLDAEPADAFAPHGEIGAVGTAGGASLVNDVAAGVAAVQGVWGGCQWLEVCFCMDVQDGVFWGFLDSRFRGNDGVGAGMTV